MTTKRADVKVDSVWTAKVSGRIVQVRVLADLGMQERYAGFNKRTKQHGGFECLNLDTGKRVHVRSAARLRKEVTNATQASSS